MIGLLLAALVLRVGLVAILTPTNPDAAATVWPTHPDVEMQRGLVAIGRAASKGQVPPPSALADMRSAALGAPLAAEPFLVAGAEAQSFGRPRQAESLFAEAKRRDPRNPAARYFLAQQYLATGRDLAGLQELAALGRLVPDAVLLAGPAISAYVKNGHAPAQIGALLDRNPILRDQVLQILAQQPSNASLLIQLAGLPAADQPVPSWAQTLITRTVEAGDYAKAHELWARLSGVRAADQGLYNPNFADRRSPAPFNWIVNESDAGLAEAQNGGLNVIYYGRDDAALSGQTMLLGPGRYRLAMTIDGNPQGSLGWTLTCLPSKAVVGTLMLKASGPAAGSFAIPAQGCAAQRLELVGHSGDVASSVSVTIGHLALVKEG